ncbi:unnamed protein product, partial [Citrullus colocynthis]
KIVAKRRQALNEEATTMPPLEATVRMKGGKTGFNSKHSSSSSKTKVQGESLPLEEFAKE